MSATANSPETSVLTRAYHRAFSLGALRPHASTLLPYFNKPGGKFVEIGARDGLKESATPYLEKALGWKGLLVEPWPHLFHKCRRNRRRSVSLNVAAVDRSLKDSCIELVGLPPETSVRRALLEEASVRQNGRPLQAPMPGGNKRKPISYVSTNSLDGILDRANFDKTFDLLIFNLMGYETQALNGLDFQRYRPTFVLMRASRRTQALPSLPPFYERVATSPHDDASTMHLFRFADFGSN